MGAFDDKFEYQTATLNGVKYNYIHAEPASGEVVGTVFLLHGWPDLAVGWRNQIPFLLSKGLRVIAPDLMGYGGTDKPGELSFYTYKRASDDIAALACHLGLSRIILGGHDWGGALAYRVATWYPELIAAFFVLNTPYGPPRFDFVDLALSFPTLHYQLQFRTDALPEYIGLGDAQNATRLRQIFNTIFDVRLPSGEWPFNATGGGLDLEQLDGVVDDTPLMGKEELDFYIETYLSDSFNTSLNWYRTMELNWKDELVLVSADAPYTAKFAQPALYIGGARDEALPPILMTGMETYFDKLSRELVNGTHWIQRGHPEEVNGFIDHWLTGSVLGNSTFGLNLTAGVGAANSLAALTR